MVRLGFCVKGNPTPKRSFVPLEGVSSAAEVVAGVLIAVNEGTAGVSTL